MAFVAVTKIESGSSLSANASIGTPGAGDALLACTGALNSNAETSITVSDGINTWTQDKFDWVVARNGGIAFASAPNASASATTVTITWNGGAASGAALLGFVYEFNSVPSSGLFDVAGTVNSSAGSTSVSTTSLTNVNANDVFLAVFVNFAGGNPATVTETAAGWTMPTGGSETNGVSLLVGGSAYIIVSSVAAQSNTWTDDNVAWIANSTAYKVTGGAAPAAVNPPMRTLRGVGI